MNGSGQLCLCRFAGLNKTFKMVRSPVVAALCDRLREDKFTEKQIICGRCHLTDKTFEFIFSCKQSS